VKIKFSLFLALVVLAAGACRKQEPAPAQAVQQGQGLPFIADDYEKALATAKERKVPVFVDVWASWCHTCLSMKQYVLTDPVLTKLAGSFVWLAIDSERPDNAAFLKRFPTRNMPTLWVIEPSTQTPLLKWIGAATARELKGVLEDTLQDRTQQPEAAGAAEVNTLWLRAQRASAAGETQQASSMRWRSRRLVGRGVRARLKRCPCAWRRASSRRSASSSRCAKRLTCRRAQRA
jgi:thioredoxin-like negative regulator of GroEL